MLTKKKMCSELGSQRTGCVLIAELLRPERLRAALGIWSSLKPASDFGTWRHCRVVRSVVEKIEQLVANLSSDILGAPMAHDSAAAEVAVIVEAEWKLQIAGNIAS